MTRSSRGRWTSSTAGAETAAAAADGDDCEATVRDAEVAAAADGGRPQKWWPPFDGAVASSAADH